jgi:hypothetical protein
MCAFILDHFATPQQSGFAHGVRRLVWIDHLLWGKDISLLLSLAIDVDHSVPNSEALHRDRGLL